MARRTLLAVKPSSWLCRPRKAKTRKQRASPARAIAVRVVGFISPLSQAGALGHNLRANGQTGKRANVAAQWARRSVWQAKQLGDARQLASLSSLPAMPGNIEQRLRTRHAAVHNNRRRRF